MTERNIKVIFDTNVWISFLIGKRLSFIKNFIIDGRVTIIITNQLIEEIKESDVDAYFAPIGERELEL